MPETRWPRVGQHVVYCDAQSRDRDALITAVHGQPPSEAVLQKDPAAHERYCPINLVACSTDEAMQDGYGRQIGRFSSVTHRTVNVHGNYWRFPDEPRNEYRAPSV